MKHRVNTLIKTKSFKQLIKYVMVGTTGLVIDLGIYFLLVDKFKFHYPFSTQLSTFLGSKPELVDIVFSNIISSSLAVIHNFVLNSFFTFKVTDRKMKRFKLYFSIAAIGMVISSLLISFLVGTLGMNELLAKLVAIIFVTALQFIMNKFFTFRQ